MKTQHDTLCSVNLPLDGTSRPEAGICICGYGFEQSQKGNYNEMYSKQLTEKMELEAAQSERAIPESDILGILEEKKDGR
jgi:hypothetical protein